MATRRLNLSRDQLGLFLRDHEQIKQFERLFALAADTEDNGGSDAAFNAAANAESAANGALSVLGRIADALECLALAPPREQQLPVGIEPSTPSHQYHNSTSTDYLDFPDQSPYVLRRGRVGWGVESGTVDVGLYGATLHIGHETLYHAKNTSGGTVPAGTPVMFSGAVGASGKLTFARAVADGTVPADYMMGVTKHDVPDNDFGYVSHFGLVRGFNTTGAPYGESWADGDLLYFGTSSAGTWTKVKPAAPAIDVPVAVVVSAGSGGSGSVFVRMTVAEALTRLQDVNVASPVAGQLLIYDSVTQTWKNQSLPSNVVTQRSSPATTGFTVTVSPAQAQEIWVIISPTVSVLASGTIQLPSAANAVGEQSVTVSCTNQVTAVTFTSSGATVRGAPSALAADSTFKFRFDSTTTTWYRVD